MPILHQKVDAVFLWGDGVLVGDDLQDLEIADAYFIAARNAGGPLVGAHQAGENDGGFLRQPAGVFEHLGRHFFLEYHTLNDARAITDLQKL